MTNWPKLLRLAPLLMLPSCAAIQPPAKSTPTPPPPSTTSPVSSSATSTPLVCSELRIVLLSHADTDGTKDQVAANNQVITALCGKS